MSVTRRRIVEHLPDHPLVGIGVLVAIAGGWFVLSRWVLPRFGIAT